jgi:hypothetical protein
MQASPEVVDLNTPPSTPKDADEVCVMAQVKDDDVSPAREHSASSGDVDEVQPPKKQRVSGEAAASAAVEDEDDECVVVGSTGVNPNIDLPHTRWNCLKCPRQTAHIGTSCDKCFCVICDIPVAQCDEWAKHCSADPSDSAVMQERALRKKDMRPVFDCTLSQLTQVYPTEVNVDLCLRSTRASTRLDPTGHEYMAATHAPLFLVLTSAATPDRSQMDDVRKFDEYTGRPKGSVKACGANPTNPTHYFYQKVDDSIVVSVVISASNAKKVATVFNSRYGSIKKQQSPPTVVPPGLRPLVELMVRCSDSHYHSHSHSATITQHCCPSFVHTRRRRLLLRRPRLRTAQCAPTTITLSLSLSLSLMHVWHAHSPSMLPC